MTIRQIRDWVQGMTFEWVSSCFRYYFRCVAAEFVGF